MAAREPRLKGASSHSRLSDVAYSKLRYCITEGQFPPGTRLVELELCRSLTMGRTPIREALLRLEGDGLIESVPNAGFSVKYITVEDIEETYKIRASLECLAVRLALERGFSEGKLDEMEDMCDLMEKAGRDGDEQTTSRADLEFHRILISLARSSRLETIIRNSHLMIIGWSRAFTEKARCADAVREAQQHRRIIDQLRRRNTEGATKLLSASIEEAFQTIRSDIRAGPDR